MPRTKRAAVEKRRLKKLKASLFEEDTGSKPNNSNERLHINSSYASSFEDRKRKQDLLRARELGISEDADPEAKDGNVSEESEEEDDRAQLLVPSIERRIQETIQAIRARDPRIYAPEVHFFSGADVEQEALVKTKKSHAKGKSAREVVGAQLAAAAMEGREDAFEDDEDLAGAHGRRTVDDGNRSTHTRAYNEEQRQLRQAFLASATGEGKALGSGEEGGAEEDGEEGFFTIKPKSDKERAAEDHEARVTREELMRHMRTKKGAVASHAAELENPEAFLEAFMQSRVWKEAEEEETEEEEGEGEEKKGVGMGKEADLMESEDELEKAEEFETTCVFLWTIPSIHPPQTSQFKPPLDFFHTHTHTSAQL